MNEATAIYNVIIGGGALIAFMAPIIKLNSSIIRLTEAIKNLEQKGDAREARISKHREEIDMLKERMYKKEHELCNHENRIKAIENMKG